MQTRVIILLALIILLFLISPLLGSALAILVCIAAATNSGSVNALDDDIRRRLGWNDPTLTKLTFDENKLQDNDKLKLADALLHNTSLKTLEIPNNKVGITGNVDLLEALFNNTSLTSLDLGMNNLGTRGNRLYKYHDAPGFFDEVEVTRKIPSMAMHIADALATNNSWKSLKIDGNALIDTEAEAVALALHTNTTLEELYIGDNNIGIASGIAFAKALEKNTTLKTLDLRKNDICAEGTIAIANTLLHNTTLTELNLYQSAIGYDYGNKRPTDAAFHALAFALENNKLTSLNLGYNLINTHQIMPIVAALLQNTSLTELELAHNEIDEEGAKAFESVLQTNSTLTSLSLFANYAYELYDELQITKKTLESIRQLLFRNRRPIRNDIERTLTKVEIPQGLTLPWEIRNKIANMATEVDKSDFMNWA